MREVRNEVKKKSCKRPPRDSGQAVIEGVLACLVALNVALAGADLGKYALTWASLDQAATESARTLMNDPSGISATEKNATGSVAQAAWDASPNLDKSKTTIKYKKSSDDPQSYTHHFKSTVYGTVDRSSTADLHEAELTIKTTTKPLTWVGKVISGGADEYTVTVKRTFEYDTTGLPASKGGGKW